MSRIMGKIRRTVLAGTAVTVFLAGTVTATAAGLEDIFDAEYYADNYEDLKEAFGYDEELLYRHFLEHGLEEGRVMNPVLDVAAYRAAYADLEEAFGDDWDAYVEHYLTIGVYESNRREGVLFDPLAYAEAYGDVKETFGDDIMAIIEHYETFGIQENRTQGTADGYADIAARKEAETIAAAKSAESGSQSASDAKCEYDENGKLVKKTWYEADGSVRSVAVYGYDENGRMVQTTWYKADGSVMAVYGYDENGKLVKITSLYTKEDITWEYDAETGTAIKMAVYEKDGSLRDYKLYEYGKGGYTTKSYNAQGVLEYVTEYVGEEYDGSAKEVRFEAYVSGELSYYKTYEYDEHGNPTEKEYSSAGVLQSVRVSCVGKNGWYNTIRYEKYDASGELTNYKIYTYDENERVTKEELYNASGSLYYYYTYEYDENGNETRVGHSA